MQHLITYAIDKNTGETSEVLQTSPQNSHRKIATYYHGAPAVTFEICLNKGYHRRLEICG